MRDRESARQHRHLAVLKGVREALNGLRGTIDPEGIGAWSSDSKQAKDAIQALSALTAVIKQMEGE